MSGSFKAVAFLVFTIVIATLTWVLLDGLEVAAAQYATGQRCTVLGAPVEIVRASPGPRYVVITDQLRTATVPETTLEDCQ